MSFDFFTRFVRETGKNIEGHCLPELSEMLSGIISGVKDTAYEVEGIYFCRFLIKFCSNEGLLSPSMPQIDRPPSDGNRRKVRRVGYSK